MASGDTPPARSITAIVYSECIPPYALCHCYSLVPTRLTGVAFACPLRRGIAKHDTSSPDVPGLRYRRDVVRFHHSPGAVQWLLEVGQDRHQHSEWIRQPDTR